MKKSLIALAALAASGFAMAQSSVTLFGVVDTGVTYVDGATNWSGLTSGNNATSRLGFRGVEDLGGGLKANFWLEAGINTDSGNGNSGVENGSTQEGLQFKRRSTIGLEGGFGEVRLGRELTAAYNAVSRYDVFGTVGVAQSRIWGQAGNVIRINNMISYYTPNFSGFKAAVNYGFGEQAESRDSRYVGASLTYDNGPLSVGFGAERLNRGASYATVLADDITAYGIGASYNFGVAKLAAAYRTQENKVIAGTKVDRDAFLIGLSAPVGAAGEVKVSYNRYETEVNGGADQKADQFGLGYVHNMSKRTAVYGTYAYIKNKNGSALTLGSATLDNGKQQAVQVGVRHAF